MDRLFRTTSRPFASARARCLLSLTITGCRDRNVNGFGKDLAAVMANLPLLKEFSATGVNLGRAFINQFAHVTRVLKHLEILKLASNRIAIDAESCENLSKAIQQLQNVKVLDLSQNYLGEKGITGVVEALMKRQQQPMDQFGKRPDGFKTLAISHDSIGNAGAFALAKMFKAYPDECSEKLDVSFNGIFEQGAVAIGDALCYA